MNLLAAGYLKGLCYVLSTAAFSSLIFALPSTRPDTSLNKRVLGPNECNLGWYIWESFCDCPDSVTTACFWSGNGLEIQYHTNACQDDETCMEKYRSLPYPYNPPYYRRAFCAKKRHVRYIESWGDGSTHCEKLPKLYQNGIFFLATVVTEKQMPGCGSPAEMPVSATLAYEGQEKYPFRTIYQNMMDMFKGAFTFDNVMVPAGQGLILCVTAATSHGFSKRLKLTMGSAKIADLAISDDSTNLTSKESV